VVHDETEITADLVRDLLRDQHPDLAGRPVTLPDDCIDRFHAAYQPITDAATLRRAAAGRC